MTLATNATHKDFNKPTDSRMVAMPMAASYYYYYHMYVLYKIAIY